MKYILCSVIIVLFVSNCHFPEKTQINSDTDLKGYFVDANNGDDNNSGKQLDSPWKTVEKINSIVFEPGNNIYFKRGTSYSDGVQINGNGTKDKPITVSAYGKGNAPKFTNTNNNVFNGNAIQINGDYQIVENLYVYGTNAASNGFFLAIWKVGGIKANLGADHAIIRNNEVVDCPIGINSYSEFCLITNNNIHDCNRPLFPPGWGPLGIRIGMGNTEISYNTIHNYNSFGGNWGGDGGAIEIDDGRNPRNNIFIHHNKSSLNMGFCEISYGFDICTKKHLDRAFKMGECRPCKKEDRIIKNLIMAYNESRDYSAFTQIFSPTIDAFIENNTIIRTEEHPDIDSNVFREDDPNRQATDRPTTYRNNLVVVVTEKTRKGSGNQVYLGWPMAEFVHSNNLFFNLDSPFIVFSDNPAENKENAEGEIIANPLLVNLSEGDYHLTANSPAINKGHNEGHYSFDLNGNPIISTRDIGAYEFQEK
jgi:hypothetical protein